MRIIVVLISLFFSLNLSAQKISGNITGDDNKAIKDITVSLLNVADSAVIKYAITTEGGTYEFTDVAPSDYLLSISHIGYSTRYSEVFTYPGGEYTVPAITIYKATAELAAVRVTAVRPMVEVKADKTILNVEGTINSVGTDALELLRKSPGVLVDKDDNLSLSGKNGVQVYIDGRPSPLAGKELSDFLKNTQSSQIDAIEIITNPSAKYEAAGNAGIINIRLKKNKSFGTNGSVNAGYAIGTYPKFNGGISLNNRNRASNIYGTLNVNRSKNKNEMNFYRKLADSSFDQKSLMLSENLFYNYKAGADFFLNKISTLGIMVNGNIGETDMTNESTTPIFYTPTNTKVKSLRADNASSSSRFNNNANLNYRRADTSGRELNIDLDYGFYKMENDQWQPNIYYDATGTIETNRIIYNMLSPTEINLYSVKADYEQNFKKGKLGIGAKIAYVNTDNDFKRYNVFTNNKTLDTLRSNRFDYTENINALYVNYNRPFKGFMIQAGLRMENTTSKGHSSGYRIIGNSYVAYDSTFKRPYTDLFPSVALTINKNPMSQFGFTYSRRIDRPAYQDLNPFEFKLDEYTFQKGNTNLRPQYTNSFGFTHTYKYKLNTAINYSHVKDIFSQIVDTAEISKSFISKRNLATQDIVSLNISYPFQYKKYSAFINMNTYYTMYEANFGEGREVDLDVFSFSVYAQQSLKIGKTWTAELSGWYTAPSIWQGTFKSIAMGGIDAGVQKSLFKTKGNIKVSVSDILNTMKWGGTSNFAGQYFRANGRWESTQFKVNFTYRFGNSQVKAARQRKASLEEETKRTQSGGGLGAP